MHRFLNRLLLILYIILIIGFLFYVFFTNKSNHTGFNIFFDSIIILVASLGVSLYLRTKLKNKQGLRVNTLHFVVLVIFFCIIIACDMFNIMVGYSEWIKRGQPNKYQFQFKSLFFAGTQR
jgi:hypothetical protein